MPFQIFMFATIIITILMTHESVEAIRDKPRTNTTNPTNQTRFKPPIKPPSPTNKTTNQSNPQVGAPLVPSNNNNTRPQVPVTAPIDDAVNDNVGEAVVPKKTISKTQFVKLKNYDDDNNDEAEEEMVEIDMGNNETYEEENEEEETIPKENKSIKNKIRKKVKQVTNENTLLGQLLNNQAFMTGIKSGTGVFGSLFAICMMFMVLKFIKTL